jgi:hypothetical protein
MGEFFHAVGVFFDHLAGVGWTALAIGLALHFARLLTRTVAWRNILAASYPNERWRWIPIAKAYIGGVGINSIVPGRAGDVVKLYLVHREQPATTYTTLASTLVTETLLDLVLATLIFLWALTQGVLPSLHVLPNIPSFDWGWLFANQRATAIAVVALTIAAVWFLHWASVHIADFKQRVGQGFAILRDRGRYAREVASWQLLSWVLADRLALLVPARLPRARVDPQRAARPGRRQPLDAAAVLTRRRRHEAGAARLRAARRGLERATARVQRRPVRGA